MQAARERLIEALPLIELAIYMAKAQNREGTIGLAITCTQPDGTGQITATFEAESFIQDILTIMGFMDMTDLVLKADPLDPADA